MPSPEPSIFREKALKKYFRKQEQNVVLRLITPPVFACFWVILLVFCAGGALAWSIHVPVSVTGQGIVTQQAMGNSSQEQEVVAVLFFPPNEQAHLHVGQPVNLQIGPQGSSVTSSVQQVNTTLISPEEARSRFNLQGGLAQVIIGPSVQVTVAIHPLASARVYVGSVCAASIQTGSQSILSLLPGINYFIQ